MSNYWQKVTNSRISRRRAMAATGSAAAAAAFLAACGGSDDDDGDGAGGSSGSGSGLIYNPVDTTGQAKPGGAIKHYAAADITHFDALASNSASTVGNGSVFAYTRLLKFKPGISPKEADGTSEGEMAESWEVSPDKLTLTMKLRQGNGLKWDERAPTNGRMLDIDDVLYSYKKFAEQNPSAANVANARNASAPVVSVTASDPRTLVIKLAKPDSTLIGLFSATDHLYIMPREAEGGFDPKTEVRGNGPWQLQEYTPSARFVWKKNPNYYVSNRPFPDLIERPIITEVSQQLAQFRAGNIHTDVVANVQQEVTQLKKDLPKANLVLPNSYPTGLTPSVWFGYEGNSPFKDIRVRQAFSMLMDRESFHGAINNADAFAAEGLDAEIRYNTSITAGWGPFWLDPLGKDFGPNAKYLQYNMEEAKKLLSAAGFPNGLSTESFSNQELTYGPTYNQAVEVFAGFFGDAGVQVKQTTMPYTQYLNAYYFGYRSGASAQGTSGDKTGYNGYSVQAERPYAGAVNLMLGSWHSAGGAFHGMTPDGTNAFKGDPKIDQMIEKIQADFDQKSQVTQTHDVIRYMTGQAYMIPRPVANRAYTVYWPAIANVGIQERWAQNNATWTEEYINWWIDSTKAPFV
jgi:ABC-type transport system substrate-binding protein